MFKLFKKTVAFAKLGKLKIPIYLFIYLLQSGCEENVGHTSSHVPPSQSELNGVFVLQFKIESNKSKHIIQKRIKNPLLYYSIGGGSYSCFKPAVISYVSNDVAIIEYKMDEFSSKMGGSKWEIQYFFTYELDGNLEYIGRKEAPKILRNFE